jgi:hypothetical protein
MYILEWVLSFFMGFTLKVHRQKDRSLKLELTKNGGKTSVIG